MFNFTLFGMNMPLGLFILLILGALFIAYRLLRNKNSQSDHDCGCSGHTHGNGEPAPDDDNGRDFAAAPDDISPIHEGKALAGGCKFDSAEVERTRFIAPPPIDTSNLPAPDPVVEALLKQVTIAGIRTKLKILTGETPVTIGGNTVTIKSRNSLSTDLPLGLAYLESIYAALGIKTARHKYTISGRVFENLVAEIPGTTEPDKILIVSGHADSTAGNTRRPEKLAPGADDDASGSVGATEVAATLKQLKLGYTVRFVHFTGEEQGLWGSYAYSDDCKKKGEKIVGVLQMDMIGWCAKPGNRVDVHDSVNRNGSHSLVVALVQAAVRYKLDLKVVDTHNHAVDNRSDQAGFLDNGYQAVLISEEFTDDGFNTNYHSTGDREHTLNHAFMVEVIRMVIAAAAELAKMQK